MKAAACVLLSLLAVPASGQTLPPAVAEVANIRVVSDELSSHVLILDLQKKLDAALGDQLKQHADLWHAIQFHLTGEVVGAVLSDDAIAKTVAALPPSK